MVPESAQYDQLLELEKRIDEALLRKRVDVYDAFERPVKTRK